MSLEHRNRVVRMVVGICTAVMFIPIVAVAEDYQAQVLSLDPSDYWELNETVEGTAADSVGGITGTHAGIFGPGFGELGVPGPGYSGLGASNLAFGANNAASIDLGPGAALADGTMTVATWFQVGIGFPGGSDGGDRIWTNNQSDGNNSFQMTLGGGANLVIGLNPAINGFPDTGLPSGSGVGNFQIPNGTVSIKDAEWHHIVASRNGNNIEDVLVVVDGVHYDVDTWTDSTDTWGTTGSNAQIATRTPGDGGTALQVLNGPIDEVAVWLGRQLTVLESQVLYHASFSYLKADFDGNDEINGADVDALTADIAAGSNDPLYDLTGDGEVNVDDLGLWLAVAGNANLGAGKSYLVGDASLDGSVDVSDFNLWNSSKFTSSTAWTDGNFNGDNVIDVSDFNSWNNNKFTSSDGLAVVPEPTGLCLLLGGLLMFSCRRLRGA